MRAKAGDRLPLRLENYFFSLEVSAPTPSTYFRAFNQAKRRVLKKYKKNLVWTKERVHFLSASRRLLTFQSPSDASYSGISGTEMDVVG